MQGIRTALAAVLTLCSPVWAQWLNYPTPGIPRLPDGRPNLSAPGRELPMAIPTSVVSGNWNQRRAPLTPSNLAVAIIAEEGNSETLARVCRAVCLISPGPLSLSRNAVRIWEKTIRSPGASLVARCGC